jgi:site-specific DNA-methyltransferase (adenine-specific)
MKIEPNNIYLGDCLDLMKYIPDKSIDMILCDLPYGVTARNKWDCVIPFEKLWEQYKRVIKENGAIVLTATQPFTTDLIQSNRKWFKYSLVWSKGQVTGFLNAKKQPLRSHEDILVFYQKPPTYNPEMTKGKKVLKSTGGDSTNYGKFTYKPHYSEWYYPKSIIEIPQKRFKGGHPTQKPVELLEYLIKTYTNEGETVLDNCMGSGSTIVACINTNRKYIGIEKELKYFEIAKKRIESVNAVQMELKGV